MPTMNTVDLLDCAAGFHNFEDDANECRVCGYVEAEPQEPAAPAAVWYVEAEHFHMPGLHRSVHATEASAKGEALRLANMLRADLDGEEDADGGKIALPAVTDPGKWESAMEEARAVRARILGCEPDDLDDDDGYVTIARLAVEGAKLDPAVAAMHAALVRIAGLGPEDEPDPEDYDDTESAYGNGMDVGSWEAATIARAALAGAPAPADPVRDAAASMLCALELTRDALGMVTDFGTASGGENPDKQNLAMDMADAAIIEAEAAGIAWPTARAAPAGAPAPSDPVRDAAHDMLAALKKADLRITELCAIVNVLAGFRKVRSDDYADVVHAAIAKAEGREG